ncbi:DUF6096 family protein [Lactiplantibacillus pentosus]|uniref:DUF6096 family protein n=1 Tax=Lactiplantibacillus pentosus TaxID=1589 RepID=UPI0035D06C6B
MTVKKATKKFEMGGLQLELKLTGRDILNIEKRLGKSMMGTAPSQVDSSNN